ncbi:transposase [Rhodococcus sp. IEGM1428]|uniref:transposase n=1 Tax=Rhodococcus sp. IEGM1428 TaxID=3392191 RepID=UPI003D0D29B3
MSRKRRSFSTEYKVEAAHRVIDFGRMIAEVVETWGVNEALFGRWVADERLRIEAAAASGDEPSTAPNSPAYASRSRSSRKTLRS